MTHSTASDAPVNIGRSEKELTGNSPIRILLVEDELITAESIRILLENFGHTIVGIRHSGEEAVEAARSLCPDIILMDIMLEGQLDGIQAAARIHEFSTLPIIYLTAYSDKETVQRAKEAEPYGYILKPFNEYDLLNTIEMAMFKYRAEMSLRREKEINAGLAELSQSLLTTSKISIDNVSDMVLERAKEFTGAVFGFVGFIETKTGYLVCTTMTRDIWEKCRVPGKSVEFKHYVGMWGWVLSYKKTLLANSSTDEPRSTGTPEGHLPIDSFLGVPALIEDELVGMIGVANKEGGFSEADRVIVERLATIYALALKQKQ